MRACASWCRMSAKPIETAAATATRKSRKSHRRLPIQQRKLAGVSISVQRCRSGKYVARVVIHSGGTRSTRSFVTMEEAKAFAQRQEIEAGNAGARAASDIGDNERRVLLHAKETLAPYGKTLSDAVAHYVAHLKMSARSAPVAELAEALMEHKRTEGKSRRYLLDLTSRLGRFTRDFGTRPISSLTAEEINQWLTGLNLAPVGCNNFRRVIAVLFNDAAARGYCAEGIMKRTLRMKTVEKEPGILTVAECAALLRAAAPPVRAAVAIGLFCGVRTEELERLDWRAVDIEAGTLIIGAGVSKVSQRRTIPIRANLRAWLEPLRQLGGPILAGTREVRTLMEQARRAAGFGTAAACAADSSLRPWPNNALRHSYASYRLAQWPDAAALALEMGNSPAVLLRHYRSLVNPAAAEAFWNLTPETAAAGNVVAMKKKSMPASVKRTKSA